MFCGQCGSAHPPAVRYCVTCGASLVYVAPRASLSVRPSQPLPLIETAIVTPKPRSRRWVKWMAISTLLVVLFYAASNIIERMGPQPEEAFFEARNAYLHHDLQGFRTYVDLERILDDMIDQVVDTDIANHNSDSISDKIAELGIRGMVQASKLAFMPVISSWIEHFVVTGEAPAPIRTGDPKVDWMAASAGEVFREIVKAQVNEHRALSRSVLGNRAHLTVEVVSPVTQRPITMVLTMRKMPNNWRIVAVENIHDLFRQIDGREQ